MAIDRLGPRSCIKSTPCNTCGAWKGQPCRYPQWWRRLLGSRPGLHPTRIETFEANREGGWI